MNELEPGNSIVIYQTSDGETSIRVKSKRGTQFRIWANKILRQYLLQGYVVNECLASQKYDELSQLVKVLGRTIQNQEKLTEDSCFLLNVVVDYIYISSRVAISTTQSRAGNQSIAAICFSTAVRIKELMETPVCFAR